MDEEEEDVDTSFGGVLPSEMRIAGPPMPSDPAPVEGVLGTGTSEGLGGESALILQSSRTASAVNFPFLYRFFSSRSKPRLAVYFTWASD